MKVLYSLLCLAVAATAIDLGDHERAQVLSVIPNDEKDIAFIVNLYDSDIYDFWTTIARAGTKVDILANEGQLAELKSQLDKEGISYEIKIENVGEKITETLNKNQVAREKADLAGRAIEWTAYYGLEDIYTWMDEQAVLYPDLVTVTDVGLTFEGRVIKLLKISTGGENKPAIFSEATIHAREWIAPATLTYIINEMLTNQLDYQTSLDAVDFYFVVVTNPDGYSYSWESSRLWRKTRQPYDSCVGADPNRNFDFQWSVVGTSTNPCSEIFHGSNPYSEPCVRVLTDEMLAVADNTRVYLGFHSYAEQWLRPWGYQPVETEDSTDLISLCEAAVAALFEVNQLPYTCVLGGFNFQAGGVSDDWAYEIARIKYSYTIELRDQGEGFLLSPEHIIPSGQELFAAFQVIFEYIRDNPDDVRLD